MLLPNSSSYQVSKVYANNHATMHQGLDCSGNIVKFPGGITNGKNWCKALSRGPR